MANTNNSYIKISSNSIENFNTKISFEIDQYDKINIKWKCYISFSWYNDENIEINIEISNEFYTKNNSKKINTNFLINFDLKSYWTINMSNINTIFFASKIKGLLPITNLESQNEYSHSSYFEDKKDFELKYKFKTKNEWINISQNLFEKINFKLPNFSDLNPAASIKKSEN